ncbi:MAG: hypothetical protein FD146_1375 [Anaerolineaceae bacterium]|nr:MAG: hypothetical protein FD146_1375 [Anaerolineaceae bacterium]
MDLLAAFLLLFVLALAALYVARPFATRLRSVRGVDQALSTLLAERDRVLTALQELDFDNTLGKIPAGDYPAQREMLVQRGAAILRLLDERSGADRKPAARTPAPASTDDDLEDLIAKRRSARREKTGGFCPQCGKPVLLSDRFCPKCGHSLK